MEYKILYGVFGANADDVAKNYSSMFKDVLSFVRDHDSVLRICTRRGAVSPRMWRVGFRFTDDEMPDAGLLVAEFEKRMRIAGVAFYYDYRGDLR